MRPTFAALALVAAVGVLTLPVLSACAPLFGPAERQQVIDDQKRIDACEEVARECMQTVCDGQAPCPQCYAPYEACMNDAGLQ